MKILKVLLYVNFLVLPPLLIADEVIREAEDNTVGGGFGGAIGLLVGGAVSGGPAGALLGGLIGVYSGAFLQNEVGLSQRAYEVKTGNGEVEKVRSPNSEFSVGDDVVIVGNRLQKASK